MSSAGAQAPRILFHCPSRRGLGHVMRGLNLAKAVKAERPDAQVTVSVANPSAAALGEADVPVTVVDRGDAAAWRQHLDRFAPGLVVFDTLLPDAAQHVGTSAAYVWRRCKPELHDAIANDPRLNAMRAILIPHTEDEFEHAIPGAVKDRVTFVGPIVRAPDVARQARLRERYQVSETTFLVTSTVGGGGFADSAAWLLEAVRRAHAQLSRHRPSLRHIVVRGPFATGSFAAEGGMTVVDAEPDLVDLMAISHLVICEAGYNTAQEIQRVKAPAILVPGDRTFDDQTGRARALEAKGLARAIGRDSLDAAARFIVDVASDDGALAEMRQRYASALMEWGNQRAARVLLGAAA